MYYPTRMVKSIKKYAVVLIKGMSMGAFDLVPGVSGGTIALIAGIYYELLESIRSINISALKLLVKFKWKDFWKAINGNFLLSLVTGIFISIFSLATLIDYLIHTYPVLVWAFFFGLMLASVWVVVQDVGKWNWKTVLGFAAGTVAAFFITLATPAATPDAYWFIFICGAVAICGLMMPGTSGAFFLVLLGKYAFIVNAVRSFNITVLLIFSAGILVGITSFSHILSYVLRRFHDITIATLSGFILGSLNKVWPWQVTETYTDSQGLETLFRKNIPPNEQLLEVIGLAIAGFAIVFIIDRLSRKKHRRS
jgi:putative membrane protein